MPHGPLDDPRWPSAFPEPLQMLVAQARAQKWPMNIRLLHDADRKYLGYRCTLTLPGGKAQSFDITGPISFCIPADALTAEQRTELAQLRAAYAPPERGSPEQQCVAYEPEQARRFHAWKQAEERNAAGKS